MTRFEYGSSALLVAWFVLLAGCGGSGSSATISGVVTLDGKPLPAGSVQFASTKSGQAAFANLEGDGRYSVVFPEADLGAEYEVTVGEPVDDDVDATAIAENPPEKTKRRIPQKYSDRTTSGLKVTIANPGETEFNIDLQSR